MLTNTLRIAEELTHPVEDPEGIVRGDMAGPSTAAMTEAVAEVRLMKRGENNSGVVPSKAQVLVAAKTAWNEEKSSAP